MKKQLLFLLIFIFPNFVFATNYIDEFPIYVFGDVRPIAAVFNSIAFVTNNGIYETVLYIAVLFSVASAAYLMLARGDVGGTTKSSIFLFGTLTVLLVPVDVHIVDKRLDKGILNSNYHGALGYEKVSNVPYLVALSPSIATSVSQDLIVLIDEAFGGSTVSYPGMNDIGDVGYANLGFGTTHKYVDKILKNFNFNELGDVAASDFKSDFKSYIQTCVVPLTSNNSEVEKKLTSPNKDIFSELEPTALGLDSSYSIINRVGTEVTCESFYNIQISTVLPMLLPSINARLTEILNVTDVKKLKGIEKIALADIQSDIFASTTEQLAIFATNAAATPLIEAAINDYYRGTGISGQSIANSITAAKSTVQLQMEGLGQFKWMVQILPFAMHFMFTVLIGASILALIFVLARGLEGGASVAKNYFVGFFQFEAIRVSLALVNNLVLYYSVVGAADKMVEFGDNPLAITRLPGYLDYIATMEGVMGLLGITAIFAIPAMVLKGDISGATMALQGMSRKYHGNDIGTSREAVSQASARQKVTGNLMNDDEAMARLNKMGLSVPKGRMPLEYFSALTNDLGKMGKGAGSMLSQNSMNDYVSGSAKESMGGIEKTAGFGSTATINNTSTMNRQDGEVQGHTTNNLANMRNNTDWNSSDVGRGNAISSLGKDFKSMGINDNVKESELSRFGEGNRNMGKIDAAKMKSIGDMNIGEKDLESIGVGAKSGIDSEIGKGRGAEKNYKDDPNAYKKMGEYSERKNVGATLAKLKAQGGMEGAIDIDVKDASFKASQQKGAVEGTEETANRIKKSGESINNALDRISNELSSAKLASDNATINTANRTYGSYEKLAERMSTNKVYSDVGSLKGIDIAAKENDTNTASMVMKSSEVNTAKQMSGSFSFEGKLNKGNMTKLKDKFEKAKDANNNLLYKPEDLADMMDSNGEIKTGSAAAAWLASKQAGHLSGMHGLSIAGKTVGISIGDNDVRVSDISGGRKTETGDVRSSVDKKSTGNMAEHYNNMTKLHNTDPLTTIALARFDGDMKKAAEYARSHDMAAWVQNPKNLTSLVAAETALGITGGEGGEGAVAASALVTTGVAGAMLLNGVTQKEIDANLKGTSPVFNEEGQVTGYHDADGKRVANANGQKLDKNGKTIKRGFVSRGAGGIKNGAFSVASAFPSYVMESISNSFSYGIPDDKNFDMPNNNVDFPKTENFMTQAEFNTTGGASHTNVKTPKASGFFSSRIDAVGDALSGKGNWKTKAGLAASALVLGTASETFANILNAFDPTQLIMGQELGAGSDVVPMRNSGISTVASSALIGGGNNSLQYAEMLKDPLVRQEFAMMKQEQKNGLYQDMGGNGQDVIQNEIMDIGSRIRNVNNTPELKDIAEEFFDTDTMQQLQKDIKKIKRKR